MPIKCWRGKCEIFSKRHTHVNPKRKERQQKAHTYTHAPPYTSVGASELRVRASYEVIHTLSQSPFTSAFHSRKRCVSPRAQEIDETWIRVSAFSRSFRGYRYLYTYTHPLARVLSYRGRNECVYMCLVRTHVCMYVCMYGVYVCVERLDEK